MELRYESRIDGEFKGWDGELINGTSWKQYKYGYKYVYKYQPKVRIWEDENRYYLEVDGIEKMLQVVRI